MDTASIATLVTAGATAIYGIGTVALVYQLWRDRVQRDKHFQKDKDAKKIADLHTAFYDAWGYWQGHIHRSAQSIVDADHAGKVFEALIRLECQLRLNNHSQEANDLGIVVRTNLHGIPEELGKVGAALGLLPPEYRIVRAVGFAPPTDATSEKKKQ